MLSSPVLQGGPCIVPSTHSCPCTASNTFPYSIPSCPHTFSDYPITYVLVSPFSSSLLFVHFCFIDHASYIQPLHMPKPSSCLLSFSLFYTSLIYLFSDYFHIPIRKATLTVHIFSHFTIVNPCNMPIHQI